VKACPICGLGPNLVQGRAVYYVTHDCPNSDAPFYIELERDFTSNLDAEKEWDTLIEMLTKPNTPKT